MDWSNERYVRLYTRDTVTWKLLDWRARVVLTFLIRKVDRAGVLDVGHDGVLGLAAVLELPLDLVEAGIAQLTASRGGLPTVLDAGTAYVLPNYVEAQEAASSDPQRKRESRSRRRDLTMAQTRGLLQPGTRALLSAGPTGHETGHERDDRCHETGPNRDERSQVVTPCLAEPILADPEISPPARAIPRSTEPVPVPAAPAPGERQEARQLWRELEQARAEAAAELGVEAQPLAIGDPGERDLADLVASARTRGPAELATLVRQARHAIAMARAETTAGVKPFEWFTGAVFRPNNFRRLVGMTAVATARAGPRGSAERAPEPVRKIKTL